MLIAHHVQHVSLTGPGIIEGCAEEDWWGNISVFSHFVWRDGIRRTKDMKKGNTRPGQLLAFVESQDIRIMDVTIQGTTGWTCLLHGCERVQIRGVKIFNGRQDANTDGFDIDTCRYVTVSDCIINTGDDCIAIRGSAERLSNPAAVCEYITVTNCVFTCSADAVRIGVGNGAVRHVRISNITVEYAGAAIDFNTSYGGAGHCELDDINFSNMSVMGAARLFTVVTDAVPLTRVTLENIRGECMGASYIRAKTPGAMDDVTVRNVDFYLKPLHVELTPDNRRSRGDYVLQCENVTRLRIEGVRYFIPDSLRAEWCGEEKIVSCT